MAAVNVFGASAQCAAVPASTLEGSFARQFDGVQNYVSVPVITAFGNLVRWTLELWMNIGTVVPPGGFGGIAGSDNFGARQFAASAR